MNVLFLTGEMAPYAKAGGLGDVAAALPAALHKLGVDVRVVLPRYGRIDRDRWGLTPAVESFRFPAGFETITASLLHTERDGVPVYFVEIPWLFGDRDAAYGHDDDPRRFALFCGAVFAGLERLGWRPDVVHANDWHTALAPAMLRGGRAGAAYMDTAGVLTIHNLAYQGWVDRHSLDGAAAFLPHWVSEQWVNLLGLGLGTADMISTVSPTYAREILSSDFGEGLDGLLRSRQDRLRGILNGLDTQLFNPQTDPHLPATFSADDLSGKARCKAALQAEAGFAPEPAAPLLGAVSRLVDQKGFDLFTAAAEPLLRETPVQVVVLGTGSPHYEGLLGDLERRYPGRVRAWLTFDAALAQRIYGGADMFLMPSRFEPCGLGQMIAMRYGAVPVVRGTGGLADTVHEGPPEKPGTGFVFWEYTVEALRGALDRALLAFGQFDTWGTIMRQAMREDRSWDGPARQYLSMYEDAVRLRGA